MHSGTWFWLQGVKRERKKQVSNNEREKEERKERDEEKKQRAERKIELIGMCYSKIHRNNKAEERKGKNA